MSKEQSSESINTAALEPLYEPCEEPRAHRIRNPERGKPAIVQNHRRPSPIQIVQTLRAELKQWRESFYLGGRALKDGAKAAWCTEIWLIQCSTPAGR